MSTLDDLRSVLAEEPDTLRAPDLDAVRRDGARARRRRRAAVGVGWVAAAAVVATLAGVATGVGPSPQDDPATGRAPEQTAALAAATRAAVDGARGELEDFTGQDLADASEDSYVLGTPDAEDGDGSVPRGDEQWARVLWWRFAFDVSPRAEMYVLVDAATGAGAAGDAGDTGGLGDGACTNVFSSCSEREVPGGRVAVERGAASEGGTGPGRTLRVSFTPDSGDRSWVLAQVTTRSGEAPYTADQLIDLATSPEMSLPEPLPAR